MRFKSGFRKFVLLSWKNLILQWRHPARTIFQLVLPLAFSLILAGARSGTYPVYHDQPILFYQFDIKYPPIWPLTQNILAWSPENEVLRGIIDGAAVSLNMTTVALRNSTELQNYCLRTSNDTFAGVVFDDTFATITQLPKKLTFSIRFPGEMRRVSGVNWMTDSLFPSFQDPGPRTQDGEGGYPGYDSEGFLAIQDAVSKSIINHQAGRSVDIPAINLQMYPYPEYNQDDFLSLAEYMISLAFILGFSSNCIFTVKLITLEKEKQLKEAMKIMGLPGWLHWLAWFAKSFVFNIILCILIVIIVSVKFPNSVVSLFNFSDPIVLFLLLIIFSCAAITYCFLISSFFSKANLAATVASVVWFVSYVPYTILAVGYDTLTQSQKILSCLSFTTAVAHGLRLMLVKESTQEGMHFYNIWTPTADDDFVLGHVLIMLLFDIVLYQLLAIYVETVYPGKYGIPQVWYFPFTKSYWCGTSTKYLEEMEQSLETLENEMFEAEPKHLKKGIQIQHLRKVYNTNKAAVKDLTLNMYEDQITVLLGHNGAGKTTAMSMLTGLFPPTSGTAVIAGHDIRTDIDGVRGSLGLCPQFNILFDELTVKEHLYFYTKLKGLDGKTADEEVRRYIKILDLQDKANSQSHTLSGGMKRKLSVGIALCGKSKVVILDEPSSGMDPAARRTLWDLLQEEKKGRTILLTTHFMDEADVLGDRIAIMADGVLKCCGSSFFLKKQYGTGYHLIMDKAPNCDVSEVTKLIQRYIPGVKIDADIGSELSYILSEDYLSVFEDMLLELEDKSSQLGVSSYGVSLTTMEEVFLKVGTEATDDDYIIKNSNSEYDENGIEIDGSTLKLNINEDKYLKGFPLIKNQIYAMSLKKVKTMIRSWKLLIVQILIPIVLVISGLASSQSPIQEDLPPLTITLNSYASPVTAMSAVNASDTASRYFTAYENYLAESDRNYINVQNDNFEMYLLEKAREDVVRFSQRYIAGAEFRFDSIIGWFNVQPYHSAPLTLNLLHNAILQSEASQDYEITVVNRPLPYSITRRTEGTSAQFGTNFFLSFNICIAITIVASFYVMFCIRERVNKAKQLQFISGTNVFVFWGVSYFWDFLTFSFTSVFFVLIIAAFQVDGFSTADQIGRIFLVVVAFQWAVLPMMYITSFLFDVPSTGYTFSTIGNMVAGLAAFILVQFLNMIDLENLAKILKWLFILIPQYCITAGLYNLYSAYSGWNTCRNLCQNDYSCWAQMCTAYEPCCTTSENYYAWEEPGIGKMLSSLLLAGPVLCAALYACERRLPQFVFTWFLAHIYRPKETPQTVTDDDVLAEKTKIKNSSEEELKSYSLVLKDATKYYKKFLAVNKLCLGVKPQECFGLLGVNGAGKTTTFQMMTGDEIMSSGEIWLNGFKLQHSLKEILNLKHDPKAVFKSIGYCPQFDALIEELTGRETLTMFCLVRGFSREECKFMVVRLANEYNFIKHIDKKVKEYSGGNRRKLSSAIACIGDSQILFLDEPTTGMDPHAKRLLWNILSQHRENGKCIILTSHSMEECEALCTRLGIMVNGEFLCLGSTQHLKSKFSEGYTLTIKVRKEADEAVQESDIKKIEKFVEESFPGAVLRENVQQMLTYYLPDKSVPWSKMFGIMERSKAMQPIEDYSLTQSSLEQVFLSFTKFQK